MIAFPVYISETSSEINFLTKSHEFLLGLCVKSLSLTENQIFSFNHFFFFEFNWNGWVMRIILQTKLKIFIKYIHMSMYI